MRKAPATEYGRQVDAFRQKLLQHALIVSNGNRTHAARTLGLQRTYLLRLIRDFGIRVPIPERCRRANTNGE